MTAQLNTDGTHHTVDLTTEENCALDALQQQVSGYIERVPLPYDRGVELDMWANEEGISLGLDINPAATIVANLMRPRALLHGQTIGPLVGPVVITASDEEGNTCSLTDQQITFLQNAVATASSGPMPL